MDTEWFLKPAQHEKQFAIFFANFLSFAMGYSLHDNHDGETLPLLYLLNLCYNQLRRSQITQH